MFHIPLWAEIVTGLVAVAAFVRVSGAIRYVGNNRVAIIEKL
jgi:hypothetical protein